MMGEAEERWREHMGWAPYGDETAQDTARTLRRLADAIDPPPRPVNYPVQVEVTTYAPDGRYTSSHMVTLTIGEEWRLNPNDYGLTVGVVGVRRTS